MAQVHRAESVTSPVAVHASDPARLLAFDRHNRAPSPVISPLALAQLIEGEIIPRLMLAHQSGRRVGTSQARLETITVDDVSLFSQMVLNTELEYLVQHVTALLDRGIDIDTLCFDLLSPTAKRLGAMWEDDLCSFADVTVGLCRLQQIVYELADRAPNAETATATRTALFALTPGDQHSFGLVLVVEFFRRAGWRTVSAPDASLDELVDLVSGQTFDLIGFSMSDEKWLEPLPAVISALRMASRNPSVRVIVGGRVFSENPELTSQVGADATAEDARQAVQSAARLVDDPATPLDRAASDR